MDPDAANSTDESEEVYGSEMYPCILGELLVVGVLYYSATLVVGVIALN